VRRDGRKESKGVRLVPDNITVAAAKVMSCEIIAIYASQPTGSNNQANKQTDGQTERQIYTHIYNCQPFHGANTERRTLFFVSCLMISACTNCMKSSHQCVQCTKSDSVSQGAGTC